MAQSPAADIIQAVGGPENVQSLTHCATRLRFQLHDTSNVDPATIDKIPGVMGVVPQGAHGMQVVIGGAVQGVYEDITRLPEMQGAGAGAGQRKLTDAELKEQARQQGVRGRFSWLDGFFEFLGDSFRPILPALLGASLFITAMSLLATTHVIGNWADPRVDLGTNWNFVNQAWQSVFYFLPVMVAYNASKKLGADPWVGFAIMGFLLLPGYSDIMTKAAHASTLFGTPVSLVHIWGLPLYMRGYGSQVFPPLLMAAVLGPLYRLLKRIIPANVQLVFVPFLAMLIMLPLTAFIIGPIGIVAGAGLANVLQSINNFSPFIFALIIPLAYPFMVPLGLHWPINAIMLANIASDKTGHLDFIQGPMGSWNFACFGATAAVLVLSMRHRDAEMKQTASGALAAGLLGGISEPSLYGIHLRFKRIYPSMLVGCLVGGVISGLGGGIKTGAFAFTSLLTIPVFHGTLHYIIAIAASFFVSMALVLARGYLTPEQKAELAARNGELAPAGATTGATAAAMGTAPATVTTAAPAASGTTTEGDIARAKKPALLPGAVTEITAPLAGRIVPLSEVPDPVFSKGTVGLGCGIEPTGDTVYCPAPGKILVAQATGHAFGISLDSGVELLIHVGIDTVNLEGRGFEVLVKRGDLVDAGTPLVRFDRRIIEEAGYSLVTPVLVTNAKKFGAIDTVATGDVQVGTPILKVSAKQA